MFFLFGKLFCYMYAKKKYIYINLLNIYFINYFVCVSHEYVLKHIISCRLTACSILCLIVLDRNCWIGQTRV